MIRDQPKSSVSLTKVTTLRHYERGRRTLKVAAMIEAVWDIGRGMSVN